MRFACFAVDYTAQINSMPGFRDRRSLLAGPTARIVLFCRLVCHLMSPTRRSGRDQSSRATGLSRPSLPVFGVGCKVVVEEKRQQYVDRTPDHIPQPLSIGGSRGPQDHVSATKTASFLSSRTDCQRDSPRPKMGHCGALGIYVLDITGRRAQSLRPHPPRLPAAAAEPASARHLTRSSQPILMQYWTNWPGYVPWALPC